LLLLCSDVLLSLVIPTHNVEEYLEQCLRSILLDTGAELEVIVVDDGSTDNTVALLRKSAANDARLTVLTHPAPLGPGPARNTGLSAASGDFVWFVDGDDWLAVGAVRTVAPRLEEPIDLLFVDYVAVDQDGRMVNGASTKVLRRAPKVAFTVAEWPKILSVLHVPWNKIVRRNLLQENSIVFPQGVGSDTVFTYRTLRVARSIAIEPSVCYAWRIQRPGQLTRSSGEHNLVRCDHWRTVLEAYADESPAVREALFARLIAHGWTLLADPFLLRGPARREFFHRWAAIYRDHRSPGLPTSFVLASDSWTVGRLRILPRQVKLRMVEISAGCRRALIKHHNRTARAQMLCR